MALYNTGEIIKALRKQKELTQAELAEGIVETFTLSRIENNKQVPSKIHLDALMQRLGFSSDTYPSNLVGDAEYRSFELKKLAVEALVDNNYIEVNKLIEEMERNKEFETDINRQFLMRIKSLIVYLSSRSSTLPVLPMEAVYEALKITIPNFSEEKIDTYFLTNEEAKLINSIAVFYSEQGDMQRAIKVFKKLKRSTEKSYEVTSERTGFYSMVLYNLSKNLGLHSCFNEAIEICEEGIEFCVKNDMLRNLPLLIFNKAYCLCALGSKAESRVLVKQAYYSCLASMQYRNAEIAKKYALEKLDMVLD